MALRLASPRKRVAQEKLKMKVCLAGDTAVGKTSLVRRFVYDQFDDDYIATLGAKVTKKVFKAPHPKTGRNVEVDITIWDIMGNKGFRELLKDSYFYQAQGILAVCDVTRADTLPDLEDWWRTIQKVSGDVPMFVMANKVDLKEDAALRDQELEDFCKPRGWPYAFTSAKTGENVELAFQEIVKLYIKKMKW